MKFTSIRSPLAKARNWGSAHDGVHHFLWQRITAIALVPLCIWFVWSILGLVTSGGEEGLAQWLSSGVHAALVILFLLAMFFHAKLGMQVIIEDYVHCPAIKISCLLANLFFMYGMAAISVIAVLKLHLITPQ